MRIMVIALVVMLLFSSVVGASSFERDRSLEAEGQVDLYTEVGSAEAVTYTGIKGEGKVALEDSVSVKELSLDSSIAMALSTDANTRRTLRGAYAVDLVGQQGFYGTMINPSAGSVAFLDQYVSVTSFLDDDDKWINTIFETDMEAYVEKGRFRSIIDFVGDDGVTTLYENLSVKGKTFIQDYLKWRYGDSEDPATAVGSWWLW